MSPKFIVPGTTNRLKNRRFGESSGTTKSSKWFRSYGLLQFVSYDIQPVGSVFFVEALLLFRFAFQQSGVFLAVATLLVFDGTRPSNHPHICTCDNVGVQSFTHAQTCDNVRVQSATKCTASVHTLHMPKPVITFVFKVLRNALLQYINL